MPLKDNYIFMLSFLHVFPKVDVYICVHIQARDMFFTYIGQKYY